MWLGAFPLSAQDLIYFFAAPGDGAVAGLTWGEGSLFSLSVSPNGNTVYKLDTLGGIISSFDFNLVDSCPDLCPVPAGLAWDGAHLWMGEALGGNLHKFTSSGTEVEEISTGLGGVAGLTWDGNYLWAIGLNDQSINQLNSGGQIIKSFSLPTFGDFITGLGWDGASLWVCGAFLNQIYLVSTSGTILKAFDGPGLSATDLEWQGSRYLWVADLVTDRIYKLDVTSVQEIVNARIEFPGGHWPMAWKFADRKPSCDTTSDPDVEDLTHWNDLSSKEYQEKLACRRKVNCFIGDLNLEGQTFDVGDILIETVRANETVPVMTKTNCQDDNVLSASAGNPAPQACYDIKYYRHLDRFNGTVLRVRFDANEIFKTIDWAGAGDTVKICVSGYLTNGMKFMGCMKIVIVGDNPTDVKNGDEPIPQRFALLGNYPNPFNASTMLKFQLSRNSFVELTVYNILGQKVRTLVKEQMTAGNKQVLWDGTDESGKQLATGIYFYKIITAEGRVTGKMTMLK
jgi:hypothetical protein